MYNYMKNINECFTTPMNTVGIGNVTALTDSCDGNIPVCKVKKRRNLKDYISDKLKNKKIK